MSERRARVRSAALSTSVIASGAVFAGITAATLVIADRTFSDEQVGDVAVAAMFGLFASQLVAAAVVEARLSSGPQPRHVVMPRWLTVAALVAAVVLAVFPRNAVVLACVLPVVLAALEVGRSAAVSERLDRREIASSVALGLGLVVGIVATVEGWNWGFVPVAVGVVASVLIKSRPVPFVATAPDPAVRRWILIDVSIVGVSLPLINGVILAVLGDQPAFIFAAVSTVSGLVAIPLNFMRVRLLKSHSRQDVAIAGVLIVAATGALLVANALHVFEKFYPNQWVASAVAPVLLLACLWRASSFLSTIPFAALRRGGFARHLTGLRAIGSALAFGLAVLGVSTGSAAYVFGALVMAELVQAWMFTRARRTRLDGQDAAQG